MAAHDRGSLLSQEHRSLRRASGAGRGLGAGAGRGRAGPQAPWAHATPPAAQGACPASSDTAWGEVGHAAPPLPSLTSELFQGRGPRLRLSVPDTRFGRNCVTLGQAGHPSEPPPLPHGRRLVHSPRQPAGAGLSWKRARCGPRPQGVVTSPGPPRRVAGVSRQRRALVAPD